MSTNDIFLKKNAKKMKDAKILKMKKHEQMPSGTTGGVFVFKSESHSKLKIKK